MRNFISYLLVLILLVCCALSSASAEAPAPGGEIESGSYTYTVQDDGTVMIIKYNGKDVALTVPDTLDGIAVTAIPA